MGTTPVWLDSAQGRLIRSDWYTEAGRDDLAAECLGTMPGPDGVAELPYGNGDGDGDGYGSGD